MISTDPYVWLDVFFVFCILSYFYKSNPLFRMMQVILIGGSIGNMVVMGIQSIQGMAISKITEGRIDLLIPIIIGLLFFSRFIPKFTWLDRYSTSYLVAVGAALMMSRMVFTDVIKQITASINPLLVTNGDPFSLINALLMVFGTSASISYFIFTKEQKGPFGYWTRFGRIMILVAFGCAYGNSMVGYSVLVIRTVVFLLRNWLQVI